MPTCTPPLRPSRLTLGTVQLGIAYGIANSSGQPDTATAEAILDHALAGGITTFDTARAYGSSEAVIGTWLAARSNATSPDIVTKLAPLPAATPAERRAAALASLDESRRVLGLPRLGLVLAHRENDLLDSAVIEALEMEREQGGISGYGASVYTVEAAARLLDLDRIAALQVPMSAADQRFVDSGIIARAAAAGAPGRPRRRSQRS
jgi:aryl-alcohol dehydrogenase-like predicted oxidoreductase